MENKTIKLIVSSVLFLWSTSHPSKCWPTLRWPRWLKSGRLTWNLSLVRICAETQLYHQGAWTPKATNSGSLTRGFPTLGYPSRIHPWLQQAELRAHTDLTSPKMDSAGSIKHSSWRIWALQTLNIGDVDPRTTSENKGCPAIPWPAKGRFYFEPPAWV